MFQLMYAAALVGLSLRSVAGLTITAPTAGQQVDLATSFAITWKEESGDPENISIDLLNSTSANPVPILQNIAHNLNTSTGHVNVTWPYSVPNDTAAYQLYFIATASGDDVANSAIFNLTLPQGETRGQAEGTVGPYGTHPSTDYPSTSSAHHLSGGAIAGIVIGCIALLTLCAIGLWLFVRRRRQQQQRRVEEADEGRRDGKPELDAVDNRGHKRKTGDTVFSTELDADSTDMDKKERIDSGELEGDTLNYLRYELPSTPPPPVELADNQIAAAEMPSPDPQNEKDDWESEKDEEPSRLGDWPLSSPVPRRPESVRSSRTAAMSIRSGSTTLGGGREKSFAEALHDLVSQELRREV